MDVWGWSSWASHYRCAALVWICPKAWQYNTEKVINDFNERPSRIKNSSLYGATSCCYVMVYLDYKKNNETRKYFTYCRFDLSIDFYCYFSSLQYLQLIIILYGNVSRMANPFWIILLTIRTISLLKSRSPHKLINYSRACHFTVLYRRCKMTKYEYIMNPFHIPCPIYMGINMHIWIEGNLPTKRKHVRAQTNCQRLRRDWSTECHIIKCEQTNRTGALYVPSVSGWPMGSLRWNASSPYLRKKLVMKVS